MYTSSIHEVHEPPPQLRDASERPVQAGASTPRSPVTAMRYPVGPRPPAVHAAIPAWPGSYALQATPGEYATTITPGVLFDRGSGQRFIVERGRPYAVVYDRTAATWRVVDPLDAARPQVPVCNDPATGHWVRNERPGLRGGGLPNERGSVALERRRLEAEKAEIEASLQGVRHMRTTLQASMQESQRARDEAQRRVDIHENGKREAERGRDALELRRQLGEVRLDDVVRLQQNEVREWDRQLQQARHELHIRADEFDSRARALHDTEADLQRLEGERADVELAIQRL
jgi:hypothetical protein